MTSPLDPTPFDTKHERLMRLVSSAKSDPGKKVSEARKDLQAGVAQMLREGDQAEMFEGEAA